MKSGWYERIEEKKINNDWVKLNCKLTDRELKLLNIVDYRKLIRRDHLEILHDGYRDIPNRTIVLNRSIKKLFSKMCLDKVHEIPEFEKGNLPCIVAIDRAGAIILNKKFKRRIPVLNKFINDKEFIFRKVPTTYLHHHGINQLEVDTVLFCLRYGENQCRLIRWDLEEDNKKQFQYDGSTVIVQPDIFMILNIKNKPFIAFIEYDTGTENQGYSNNYPTLLEKVNKYSKYKISRVWTNEWWAIKINTDFPMLLFVTEDIKRIQFVESKGEKMGLKVKGVLASEYTLLLEGLLR